MKRSFAVALAALAASSSAFAEDIDFQPYCYVSSVIREAQADRQRVAVTSIRTQSAARADTPKSRIGLLNANEAGGRKVASQPSQQAAQAPATAQEAAAK